MVIPKTVFITGATGEFGTEFAKRFAAVGSKLILHGRNADKLNTLMHELDADCYGLQCDLSDRDALKKALEAIPEEWRDIGLLINNAGLALTLSPTQDVDQDDFDTMIEINNRALVAITRHCLPNMVARKSGHIINIGSTAGSYPYPGGHVYCASKAFVKQFSLSLRGDLAGTNIRVTNIEPGMVETQFSTVRFKGDTDKAQSVYADTAPLQAEDVAESVFWAATLPVHVNINRIELMPTVQSFGPHPVERFT